MSTDKRINDELAYDVCDACDDTGIEERKERDDPSCVACKGRKVVPIIEKEHIPTAGDFL